jgi:hypothetical protein
VRGKHVRSGRSRDLRVPCAPAGIGRRRLA